MPRADTRGIFTLKIFTVYLYKEGSGLWPDPGKSPNEEKRALTGCLIAVLRYLLHVPLSSVALRRLAPLAAGQGNAPKVSKDVDDDNNTRQGAVNIPPCVLVFHRKDGYHDYS